MRIRDLKLCFALVDKLEMGEGLIINEGKYDQNSFLYTDVKKYIIIQMSSL